ncbi:MAG: ImmA/IrrE family metallo-endopeptidase [Vulcanibacillus sp.]
MSLDEKLINEIERLVQEIKKENDIKNEIIRDDVFSILQALNCIVLYYPLEDEEIDGCHIKKPINDQMEQFVFINSNNTRERQAFIAAHELGHIWEVDKRLKNKFPDEIFNAEEVVNRFAAELLMPRRIFQEAMANQLKKMNYAGPSIKIAEMIKLIAYLMNYFFVPFKSVVYRLNEIGKLDEKYNDIILEFKDSDFLKELIKTEQYTRLGITNKLRSMDNLPELLLEAEKRKIFNANKLKNIRNDFDIKHIDESFNEDVEF